MNTRARGAGFERHAERFLQRQGLRPVTRNFTCRVGEIDLIMRHDDCLVFVEVRYRADPSYGSGADTVTRTKQSRLSRAAALFLARNPRWSRGACRFDVVSLEGPAHPPSVAWYRHAFESALPD